jgi:transposase
MSTPTPTPSTPPHHRYLSRDERLQVQTLHLAGHTQTFIANLLGITRRQVSYAIASERVTPKKRHGRPSSLTDAQVDELEAYIRTSRASRQMSYLALAEGPFQAWGVGEYVIRHALRGRGYARYIAYAKPPLSEENKRLRLKWAEAHKNWSREQWWNILWSDETWVTGGRHRKVYVTRKRGEELDNTCIVEKLQRKRGWMFWGCFSGTTKGPCLFWEKDWGKINKESYCERIVPVIHGWLRLHPELQFMQDNAPGHAATYTIDELRERGIHPIYWPPFSPDLNLIEPVWNKMKDYIGRHYPDLEGGRQRSYDQLRVAIREAWDSIPIEYLEELIDSMPARCQAVIDARGGHTKY